MHPHRAELLASRTSVNYATWQQWQLSDASDTGNYRRIVELWFLAGEPADSNPYRPGSVAYREFAAGWQLAKHVEGP